MNREIIQLGILFISLIFFALATVLWTWHGWRITRGTTLRQAYYWSLISLFLSWIIIVIALPELLPRILDPFRGILPSPRLDLLMFLWAVSTLCPPIAVLGARQPTVRAWNYFVILPLIAVIFWPLAAQGVRRGDFALNLEMPMLVGFAIPLVMGWGNYFTRRTWLYALLMIIAVCWTVANLVDRHFTYRMGFIGGPVFVLWFAYIMLPALTAFRFRGLGPERVWEEFSTLYGLVWQSRVGSSLNADFEKQALPIHASGSRLLWKTDDAALRTAATPEVIRLLQWHLRRFVEPEWIDARLAKPSSPADPEELLNQAVATILSFDK